MNEIAWAPVIINLAVTAYLCWKLQGGGLYDSILKKANGPDTLGAILAFIGYVGLSAGLVVAASIARIVTSVWLLWLALHAAPVLAAIYVGIWAVGGIATILCYRSGIFAKKN